MAGRTAALRRFVPHVRRALLVTGETPLRRLWLLLYAAVARAGTAYLTRGERQPSVYARSTYRTGEFLPGLSDVDLAIVVEGDPGSARRRWDRLDRNLPLVRAILDWPRIYGAAELRDLGGDSVFTYGLDPHGDPCADRSAYQAGGGLDTMRMLERPGLYGDVAEWRLLRGPERRPPLPERDAQAVRLAAWSELVYCWRLVFRACVEPPGPLAALLAVKVVAEPARIWLWLLHGERSDSRTDALVRALARLPEEEDVLRRALALERSLARAGAGALATVLPAVVRLSSRIASELDRQVEPAGATAVRLVGADPPLLVAAEPPPPGFLPLCDWRALAYPPPPDESFAAVPGDPGELATVVELIRAQRGRAYRALGADGVLVLTAADRPLERARQRAIKFEPSDPVSFALARGERVARFPEVPGWSARDTARRAVAEHRAWLRGPADELGLLLTAARAAHFLESLEQGEPELLLTVTETAGRLGAADALAAYRASVQEGTAPAARVVDELRRLVRKLPAYA
jgi:hypothetical protein